MTAMLRDVFADTAFWIALTIRQDQYHERAQHWSLRITGRITTTIPVLHCHYFTGCGRKQRRLAFRGAQRLKRFFVAATDSVLPVLLAFRTPLQVVVLIHNDSKLALRQTDFKAATSKLLVQPTTVAPPPQQQREDADPDQQRTYPKLQPRKRGHSTLLLP